MVAVNQQPTQSSENAARDAWQVFLQKHPRIQSFLAIVSSFFGYFLNGYAMVALVQWMVRVAGRMAESALLLATLYVTLNNVAHILVTWILPASVIAALNYLSLVAFSLLPELIVAAAIKITFEHCLMFARNRTWRNPAWVWSLAYGIPTAAFVVMTIYTLLGFVQVVATSGNPAQATGTALVIRLLAGWTYAMVEILFATIGKKSYVAILDGLRAMIATQGQELSVALSTIATRDEEVLRRSDAIALRETDIKVLRETVASKDNAIEVLRSATALQEKSATELHAIIATQEEAIEQLSATLLEKESAFAELQATAERLKRTKAPRTIAPITLQSATPVTMESATHISKSATDNGYVAIDNGDSIAISDGQGATVIATGEPRDRIKQAMLVALQHGEKINYREVAEMAQAGYSTVRKWAPAIMEEITQEIPAIGKGEVES